VHVGVPFPDPDEEAIVVPLELIDVRGELAALVELEQLLGMTDPLATPDLEEAAPGTAPAPGDVMTHTRPFRDLRPRPVEDEHRRPVEPRSRNHPGFDLRLPGGADHRPLVGPLRRVAGEVRQEDGYELVGRAGPRVRQLDAHSVGEDQLERRFAFERMLGAMVLVAERSLGHAALGDLPRLVLVIEAGSTASRTLSEAQLELVDVRNVEPGLFRDPPRAGDPVVVVPAVLRSKE